MVDPRARRFEIRRVRDLTQFVDRGDLLVLNDAATLPASLQGETSAGAPVEARLLWSQPHSESESEKRESEKRESEKRAVGPSDPAWRAVLLGPGDWQTRTEDRPAPPAVRAGDSISFGDGLEARVEAVDPASDRLIVLRFAATGDRFWSALYRAGRPVQYAHVAAPLALWHVQTPFASRPWSSEMPSAARPLAWELVLALRAKGARFAAVTHAAGLSASGDPRLDAALPLRESFEVPSATAEAVNATRASGGRVIAVGTSVVRALESAAARGARGDRGPFPLEGGVSGETELRVDGAHRLLAVDALLTGMHDPGTSHDDLLHAFAPEELLRRAHVAASARGFVGHEFGDSMLIAAAARSASPC